MPERAQPQPLALEVLRAEHGDCLLLHHGDQLVLIDGGPSGVYEAALKPRLDRLAADRGQPLWIQMVMVSHIDNDHIVGLAEMFADAREREELHLGPKVWRAGELWFNAFTPLAGAGGGAAPSGVHGAALQALTAAAPGAESQAVAAGVAKGVALRDDAGGLGVAINQSVAGDLVQTGEASAPSIDVLPGLTFTVLAPAAKGVAKLQETWLEWEQEHPRGDAQKAANLDRSVFNLSSIVVLARSGGRSLLLTGDARSDDVVAGLELAGELPADGTPLAVDVLKLPHHGSIRNVDAAFFARVRARHYVISANGRDGNPEDETLALLCDARLADDEDWTLWLTYGGEAGDGKPGLHDRLSAFLADRKATHGQEVDARFAKAGSAHTIALA